MKYVLIISMFVFFSFAYSQNIEEISEEQAIENVENSDQNVESSDQNEIVYDVNEEDLKTFVEDYIEKDIKLKGAFFIEDKNKTIFKLKFVKTKKIQVNDDVEKKVITEFSDENGKTYEVIFNVLGNNWGNLDLNSIKLGDIVKISKEVKKSKNKEK